MATKRNIARNGAMGKSFYQSTKSKRARINAGKTTDPQKPSPSGRATVCIGIEGKTTIKKPHVTKNRKAGHTRSTQDPHKIHKDQKRAKWLVELVCRVSGTRDPQDPQDPHSHVVLHMHVVI